jgi:hypothetical protein
MASSDWEVLKATNVSHSLVDTLGLDMDQNYCWNVRTTLNPGIFVVRNVSNLIGTAGLYTNGDSHTNLKIRALMRKNADTAVPFLFLRGGNASTTQGYKFALRQDGKFALYKETLEGNFGTTPLLISAQTYTINTTHHVELSTYSQPNGDTFIEAYYGDRPSDPYETEQWDPIFKTMIFYSDSPILSGYCGFGHYGVASGAYSYFDLFEVYGEQI